MGGGHVGGGAIGGGHIGGGAGIGGFRGGVAGFNGGFRGYGGYGRYGYYGYGRGYYGAYWGWPYWGWGLGWGYPYWGYDYYPYGYDYAYAPYYGGYYDGGAAGGYPAYQSPPSTTIVYPPQPGTVYQEPVQPAIHEYDQYGQEIPRAGGTTPSAGSPVYLIAFKDQSIRAAAAYWVTGPTLHYVTLEHEEKQVPLSTVDHDLSLRLNHERHVPFQLSQ